MDSDLGRQLSEAGLSDADAQELTDLASEIGQLPDVKPRLAWLHESKWRLLREFDEQRTDRDAAPSDAEE